LLCLNVVKFGRREIGEIVRYLLPLLDRTKNNKISLASQTVVTARTEPKICQGQPPTMYSKCSKFYPNRFTFGGVIAERVNSAKLPRRVNTVYWPKPSFEPNNKLCQQFGNCTSGMCCYALEQSPW